MKLPTRMRRTTQPRRLGHQTDFTSTSVAFAGQSVADVLACWPQTAPVFLHHRLACVGCPLARFDLITDVAAIYGIDLDRFLYELRQAIEGGKCEPERK